MIHNAKETNKIKSEMELKGVMQAIADAATAKNWELTYASNNVEVRSILLSRVPNRNHLSCF